MKTTPVSFCLHSFHEKDDLRIFFLDHNFNMKDDFRGLFFDTLGFIRKGLLRDGANLPRQLTSLTFTIVHCVILPSEDTEKKFMLLSRSSFCHFTWNEKEKKKIRIARNWQRTRLEASLSEIFQKPQFHGSNLGPGKCYGDLRTFCRHLYNNPSVYSETM